MNAKDILLILRPIKIKYHIKKESYMKTKKIGRKLALNKKTIASLNSEQLLKVIGADISGDEFTCKPISCGCPTISGPGDTCCQPNTHGGVTGCTVIICP
jgi:hypothetical protein